MTRISEKMIAASRSYLLIGWGKKVIAINAITAKIAPPSSCPDHEKRITNLVYSYIPVKSACSRFQASVPS